MFRRFALIRMKIIAEENDLCDSSLSLPVGGWRWVFNSNGSGWRAISIFNRTVDIRGDCDNCNHCSPTAKERSNILVDIEMIIATG